MTHVLIVEDDLDSGEVLREFLAATDPGISWARSGVAALKVLADEPSLVAALVDLSLPDMDGLDVARAARRRFPGLRLALVTGFASGLLAADQRLADRIFEKPVNPDELLAFIREALAQGPRPLQDRVEFSEPIG